MGYDLVGAVSRFRCNGFGWTKLLNLAVDHGWEPTGTRPRNQPPEADTVDTVSSSIHEALPRYPDRRSRFDSYMYNDWQLVTAEDAKGIADALAKAVKGVERLDPERQVVPADFVLDILAGDDFLIQNSEYTTEFVAFCREGAFTIT